MWKQEQTQRIILLEKTLERGHLNRLPMALHSSAQHCDTEAPRDSRLIQGKSRIGAEICSLVPFLILKMMLGSRICDISHIEWLTIFSPSWWGCHPIHLVHSSCVFFSQPLLTFPAASLCICASHPACYSELNLSGKFFRKFLWCFVSARYLQAWLELTSVP